VFVYLDADRGGVRVSVHLDTTDEQLIRADSTVRMQVEIETATVFDNLTPPPAPTEPDRVEGTHPAAARRTSSSRGGKRRQGG
jgi:hypothetical protein